MTEEEPCDIVEVRPDGSLLLRQGERERAVRIHGISVPQPPPALYLDIVRHRLADGGPPLRCETVGGGDPPAVRISYRAWQDKSGDVWKDLGLALVGQGAATAAEHRFAGRAEYVRTEQEARRRRIGIWGGKA